jgi:hypothetical protein
MTHGEANYQTSKNTGYIYFTDEQKCNLPKVYDIDLKVSKNIYYEDFNL